MDLKNRHRVVIEIDQDMRDKKIEEYSNVLNLRLSRTSAVPLEPHAFNVFDSPSKCFTDRPLRFDCVGTARNVFNRAEITMLMDQLLLQRLNCCALHFYGERANQFNLLSSLLITEVDKRMILMQSKVQRIRLEYFDVRKYDVVNLLDHVKTDKRQRSSFCCTMDLLKWLQEDYPTLFNHGEGHESLDVTYVFTDLYNRTHKVTLSLMFIYLNKMDSDTKYCLDKYFHNIHKKTKMKNLMLTDCLKEIFNHPTNWLAWFIFHVPISKGSGTIIDDLLKLATAAYDGLKVPAHVEKTPSKLSLDLNLDTLFVSEKDSAVSSAAVSFNLASKHSLKPFPNRPSIESFFSKPSITKNTTLACQTRYPQVELRKLNLWYIKIDRLLNFVVQQMQTYYDHVYSHKIRKFCSDLQAITGAKDSNKKFPSHLNNAKSEKKLYNNYQTSLSKFRKLVNEIQYSSYGPLLVDYLREKREELDALTKQCQLKQLEKCENKLMETIKIGTDMLIFQKNVNMFSKALITDTKS